VAPNQVPSGVIGVITVDMAILAVFLVALNRSNDQWWVDKK
jgi:hypothetical protein